jgi:nucleoside-diphosphate-sugar epimerase
MAVLVTGAGGFLGPEIIDKLLEAGKDVLAFDFAELRPELKSRWEGRVEFIRGDIRDRSMVRYLVEKSGTEDPIIHLAGILTSGCDRNPEMAIAVNVNGLYNVLDAAVEFNGRRTIMASTISVFGRDLPQPMTEEMSAEPDGWYGITKLMGEQMGLLFQRRHGLDFRAARFAAVTGPGRSAGSGSASLFTSFIPEKPALGEAYEIEVTEDTAYPVVYIKDAADALFQIAFADKAPSRIYNVSSGRIVVSQMVEDVKKIIPDAKYTYKPDPVIMSVVGGFKEWEISTTRIERELGWKPSYTPDEMVKDIIRIARSRK